MQGARRHRRGARRRPIGRNEIIRFGLAGLFAIVAGYLTVSVSGAAIMRSIRPDLALQFRPGDARAEAKRAEDLMIGWSRDHRVAGQAAELARAALRRDLTVAAAWRMLAMTEGLGGDEPKSRRLFEISERISRRDLPTQLWLIEDNVRRNDIAGALEHYDTALRTSGASPDILLPILVNGAADDAIMRPLAAMLRTRPPWRHLFMERIGGVPDPVKQVQLVELVADTATPDERQTYPNLVRSLAEQGHYGPARDLYAFLSGDRAGDGALVRNGDFERTGGIPPFDWDLTDSADGRAEVGIAPPPLAGHVLHLSAAGGGSGPLGRQLLTLAPGDYQLSAIVGAEPDIAPARIRWRVACGGDARQALLESDVAASARPIRQRASFRVPDRSCAAQWLTVGTVGDFNADSVAGWVDAVDIRRGGG